MKKWALAGGFVVLLIGGGVWISATVSRNRAGADLKEQLRLARLEGIPTTAGEFGALIKPCRPEDNAAPYYRKLASLPRNNPDPSLDYNLTFKHDDASIKAAQNFLDHNRSQLALIDIAVTKPRCWFNRDWSQGEATLFPELANMKNAAKLLMIRASINAAKGRSDLAIKDVDRVQIIAKHLGEEPQILDRLVADVDKLIAMKALANWAFVHPDVPLYKKELKSAIDRFTEPDERAEHTGDLYCFLWLFNAVKTPEGLRSLGVKPSEASQTLVDRLYSTVIANGKSDSDVVRDNREMWAAYGLMPEKREEALQKARTHILTDIWSEPIAARIYFSLSGDEPFYYWSEGRRNIWLARWEQFLIVYQALSAKIIPTTLDTSKILSPYDGNPVTYRYDGKQITIEVSGADTSEDPPKPSILKIPPDLPKSK